MKIINNRKELKSFVGHSFWDEAYDTDSNWVIREMNYEYPILIECLGYTVKGKAYKVRTKGDLSELKRFLEICNMPIL